MLISTGMKESLTPENSLQQKLNREELLRNLDIPEKEIEDLTKMFQTYTKEKGAPLENEHLTVRAIRHFLHDRKTEIRSEFSDSVLGQSGCFAFSVKSFLLAGNFGIESNLARSTGIRAIHVMLVDKDGQPYDVRELRRGGVKAMSIEQVRAYGNYLQPIISTISSLRSRGAVKKRSSRFAGVTPIIPCNAEDQDT